MTGRRAATFRLAWRLTRRSRGRSVLIALLVAIPVMAGTFAATTIRTAHLSPGEAAGRQLGRADAIAVVAGGTRPLTGDIAVGRSNNGDTISNVPDRRGSLTATAWAADLPVGSRITRDAWTRTTRVTVGDRAADVQGVVLDLADPMTRGIYRVLDGTAPHTSGEAAVTTSLAKHLGVHIGESIGLARQRVRVSAIVEDPRSLGDQAVVVPAAAALGHGSAHQPNFWYANFGYWLVDTQGTAPDLHDRLLRDGVVYETRGEWEDPGPELASTSEVDGQVIIVLGTVAGFGLLEILLLAGAAFAVGTRRQTHELGLLAATGGDDTDIRRTVLAQGAFLGVGGAVVGVSAGVLAVVVLRGVLERVADQRFGALDVAAADLLAVVALGVVAGLLAAIVPARAAAARSVLHMLRERYDADGLRASLPRWSIVAMLGGAALTVVAAFRWHASAGNLQSTFVNTGSVTQIAHGLADLLRQNSWPAAMWLGAVSTLAGLVRACPALVSRLATLSRPLPLSPRLALRDAGRHRHRTAPAVAAVMTVVAGAVLVLFVTSSSDLRDKHEFRPAVPIGLVSAQVTGPTSTDVAVQAAALVGGGRQVLIRLATQPGQGEVTVQAPHCGGSAADDLAACQFHGIGVASADAIDLIAGRPEPNAARALATGRAVVLDRSLTEEGAVEVDGGRPHATNSRLAAVVVPGLPSYSGLPLIYVSPKTAAEHGWRTHPEVALVKPDRTPSAVVMDRAQRALRSDVFISLQRSYHSRYSPVLLAMLGAAAIATLAGTSIAVALAMAESRADMATMAAVGASPGRRRIFAMGQAAMVAGLGTGLGVALGALVALATLGGSDVYPTSLPFRWLAAVLVAAPLLAIGVAGLVTRSRVTLTRRIA
jgi:putative ABC transport system permease protein